MQFGQITSLSYKQGFAFIDYADKRDAEVLISTPSPQRSDTSLPGVCCLPSHVTQRGECCLSICAVVSCSFGMLPFAALPSLPCFAPSCFSGAGCDR